MQRGAQGGFTLFEVLVVMALLLILMGIVAMNVKQLDDPLQNGAAQLLGFIKQVRAEAISATSAYIVRPESASRVVTLVGTTCSDATPVSDPRVVLNLPDGAQLSDTGWEFCFNSRGFPDSNIEIDLQDIGGQNKTVEVLLGGAVRIL